MMWLIRDVLHVPNILIGPYCETDQSAISIAIKRGCKTKTSRRFRKHLDAAAIEAVNEINHRLRLLRAEEDPDMPAPDALPPEVYNATVDYLEALKSYIKAVADWRDR